MAFAATLIMKLLTNYPWISWLGLIVLVYVAGEMMYRGFFTTVWGRSWGSWKAGRSAKATK
jgi:predicted tellurium resistance membrane protein TerC